MMVLLDTNAVIAILDSRPPLVRDRLRAPCPLRPRSAFFRGRL